MIAFCIRRGLQAVLVILVVCLLSFVLVRYLGDPVVNLLGADATAAERDDARQRLGLDQPVPVQFVRYLGRAVQGDFGVSYGYGTPVLSLLATRLPATIELAIATVALASCGGIAIGFFAAVTRRKWLSRLTSSAVLVGASLPTFLLGILLIHLFAVELGLLPSFGRGETVAIGWWPTGFLTVSGLQSLILPSVTLALFPMALTAELVRVGIVETLATEHIRFARARGLRRHSIYFRHALRHALVPVVTVMGLQAGTIISFSVVTETVFRWPGVGSLFISAVRSADIPLVSTYLVLVSLVFMTLNLGADFVAAWLDPRLRTTLSAAPKSRGAER